MGKLIELLEDRYWENVEYKQQSDGGYMFWLWEVAYREERLCGKKFWFIQRLVENDKIDRERMRDNWWDMQYHFPDEDLFIMSLATSDTPIDDLISYLK